MAAKKKMLQPKNGEKIQIEEAEHIYSDEIDTDWEEPEIPSDPYDLMTLSMMEDADLKLVKKVAESNNFVFNRDRY